MEDRHSLQGYTQGYTDDDAPSHLYHHSGTLIFQLYQYSMFFFSIFNESESV